MDTAFSPVESPAKPAAGFQWFFKRDPNIEDPAWLLNQAQRGQFQRLALVLFFLMSGGFITSTIFPKMIAQTVAVSPSQLIPGSSVFLIPNTPEDFNKLLVWSIIAGYASSFVPNLLNRVIAAQKVKANPPTPKAPS
jgi:hypothetical protein